VASGWETLEAAREHPERQSRLLREEPMQRRQMTSLENRAGWMSFLLDH
jgi:hypothetical protein